MNASKGFLFVLVSIVLHVSNGDVETIDILDNSVDTPLVLKTNGEKDTTCTMTRPNGTIVNQNDENQDEFIFTPPCSFKPKKYWNVNLSGTYKLTLTYEVESEETEEGRKDNAGTMKKEEKTQTYNVNWMQSVKVTPETPKIFSKQTLTIHMLPYEEDFSKYKSCEYKMDDIDVDPTEGTEKEEEKINDEKEGKETNDEEKKDETTEDEEKPTTKKPATNKPKKQGSGTITENGLCRVDLNIVDNAQDDGFWELVSITERGHRLKSTFQVTVIDEKVLEDIKEVPIVLSAFNNKIKTTFDVANILHCSLLDNHNTLVSSNFGPCLYEIQNVRKSNEGKWIAKMLLEGKVEVFEQNLNVIVLLQAKQTQCDNVKGTKKVNMICECESNTAKKCLFSGPSAQLISLTEGVGNSKYSFYSNFKDASGKQQCGLTINSLDKKDDGSWKCQIEDTCNHFIQISEEKGCIEQDKNTEYVPTAPETFYAIQDDKTGGLACSIDSDLQYCFFQTNIGEEIAGDITGGITGRCKLPTFKYTTNHTGTWKCILGVASQSKEYTKDIDVEVLTSWFQPAKEEFVYEQKVGVEMKCLNHDPEYTEVLLCRFVRPDGYIIKLDAGEKADNYESTSKPLHGVCGLKLSDMKKEDKGNWKCTAFAAKGDERVLYNKNFLVSSAPLFSISAQFVTLVSIIVTWCHR